MKNNNNNNNNEKRKKLVLGLNWATAQLYCDKRNCIAGERLVGMCNGLGNCIAIERAVWLGRRSQYSGCIVTGAARLVAGSVLQ